MPLTLYLSSTLNDLRPERDQVRQALARHTVFDSYVASEDDVITSCLDDVARCDVYLLIVGLRYGFVPADPALNPDGVSITELEWRRAAAKPRLVFLKDEASIPFGLTDAGTDEHPIARIRAFRAALNAAGQPRPVIFTDADDLGVKLLQALADFSERRAGAAAAAGAAQAAAWLAAQLDRVAALQADHLRATALHAGASGREPVLDLAATRWHDGDAPAREASAPRPLDEVLATARGAVLVVSEGGGGKTTALWRAAAAAAERARHDPAAPVPVCVNLALPGGVGDLAALRERVADAVAGVRDWAAWCDLLAATGRRALYLFDAFNELPERAQADAAAALLRFVEKQGGDTCIVASRRVPPLEPLLRGTSPFVAWEILRLQPGQVQGFLAALGLAPLHAQLPQELRSLAANPFMLIAIARTLGGDSGAALPRNRGRLYERFVRGWMDHESLKPGRGLRYDFVRVKQPLLGRLAVRMTALGQTSLADGPALDALVAAELARSAQRLQFVGGLPERPTVDDCLAEVTGDGLLRRAGGTLRFMHQSVQEFFAGLHFHATDAAALVALTPAWVDGVSRPGVLPAQRLVNALLMMAGLQDDATALVRALHDRHPLLAAAALGAAGPVDGALVATLEAAWQADLDGDDPPRRQRAAHCVVLARRPRGPLLERVVVLALAKDFEVAYAARQALMAHADPAAVVQAVFDAVARRGTDSLDDFRLNVAWLLRDLPQPALAAALVAFWRAAAPDAAPRALAARLLAAVDVATREAALAGAPDAEALRSAIADAEPMGFRPAELIRQERKLALARHDLRRTALRDQLTSASPEALAEALRADDAARREAAADCVAARGLHALADALVDALRRRERGREGAALLQPLRALEGDVATVQRLADAVACGPAQVALLPAGLAEVLEFGPLAPALQQALQAQGLSVAGMLEPWPGDPPGLGRWRLRPPGVWADADDPGYRFEPGPQGVAVIDTGVPRRLVARIGTLDCPQADDCLQRMLAGPDSGLAAAAAGALARRGWPGAAAAIRQRLVQPTAPAEVDAWLETLADAPGLDTAWVAEELLSIRLGGAGGRPSHPRWGICPPGTDWARSLHRALLVQGADAVVRAAVRDALATDDVGRRVAALAELRRWLDLDDAAHPERAAAWRTADLVDRVQALALDDADLQVRAFAAEAAQRLDDPATRPHLLAALAGADARRATAAAAVLAGLAGLRDAGIHRAVGERMAALALDPAQDATIRRAAGDALAQVGGAERVYEPVRRPLDAQDPATALARADQALEALPDDANLHWFRGHALHRLGRLPEAAASLARSATLARDAPLIPRALSALYLRLGDTARAVGAAREGVGIDPADAESQAMLAWALCRAGDLPGGAAAADIALRLDPTQAEAPWMLLMTALQAGDAAGAGAAMAHLRLVRHHLGRLFDAEWQADVERVLGPLAPTDPALQALRTEALVLLRDDGPPGG